MAVLAKTQRILRDDYINLKWPHRDRSLDGWIGDASHEATGSPENGGSDHNPNKRGVVDAIDVDKDGIHVPTVIASMIVHPSTNYVIFNRRFFGRRDSYRPRAYTGPNSHAGHIHRSILQSATAENRVTKYRFILEPMDWLTLRERAEKVPANWELQAYLNGWGYTLSVDGLYGPVTTKAVRAFQASQRITVDGVVGAQTRAKLRPFA